MEELARTRDGTYVYSSWGHTTRRGPTDELCRGCKCKGTNLNVEGETSLVTKLFFAAREDPHLVVKRMASSASI